MNQTLWTIFIEPEEIPIQCFQLIDWPIYEETHVYVIHKILLVQIKREFKKV